MYYIKTNSDELYHYGVLGMKWGVRKKNKSVSSAYNKMKSAKKDLKIANKEYSRAFNKASSKSVAVYSPIKKHRVNNDKRWEDTYDKIVKYDKSKKIYKEAKKSYKSALKEAKKPAYKKMSDKELQKRIDRLKSEKTLKNLTEEDVAPGRKFVKDVLSSSGKKAATTLATGAILYGTKSMLSKEFDVKDLAGYIAPKPKK